MTAFNIQYICIQHITTRLSNKTLQEKRIKMTFSQTAVNKLKAAFKENWHFYYTTPKRGNVVKS